MILDLRFNAVLNPKFSLTFQEISLNSRKEFNEYVSFISKPFFKDIDWWVLSPPSRNTYASPLFHNFCSIKLIQKIIDEKEYIDLVILVDSHELKKIFEDLLNKEKNIAIKVIFKVKILIKLKRFIKYHFDYQLTFFKRCLRIIIARILAIYYKVEQPAETLTLLDTFISPQYIEEDRWYGVLWKNLNRLQKTQVFFVPTIINASIFKFIKIVVNAKKNDRNNFIKEDFLDFGDLLFAYCHKKRIKKLAINSSDLWEIDLKGLVIEEINTFGDVESIFEALLTYKFLRGLAKKNIKVNLSYDWFEGHAIDKAWNLGVSKFHKSAKKVGYRAFFKSYPLYLSTYPITSERDAGVLPDIFALQGEGSIKDIKEYDSNLKSFLIPAFKSEYISKWSFSDSSLDKNILITLPISKDSSIRITEVLINESQKLSAINKNINLDRKSVV